MVTADFVLLIGGLLFAVIGAILGFGKSLEVITKGIIGWIISFVACYFLLGLVTEIGFVQNFMKSIVDALAANGQWYATVLMAIRVDIIAVAVILFLVVTLARVIVVKIIRAVVEAEATAMVIINKTLGFVLFTLFFLALGLIVFQIIAWIGGTAAANFSAGLSGSFFKLDSVFANNPLISFIEMVKYVPA